ncbi:MAG: PP2C family protein-serine/threonine phosphatase [Thermoanaerobaculia bacterium]
MADDERATGPGEVDYADLMKRVEGVVDSIAERGDLPTVLAIANRVIQSLRTELGLTGGRLYVRHGDDYVLETTFPDAKRVRKGLRVPATYPPVDALLEQGTLFMAAGDPRMDPQLEEELGVKQFAAIEIGDERFDCILAFDVARDADPTGILYSLSILRHSINDKLRQGKLDDIYREARRIQHSILPRRMPVYGSFEFAARSEPMEIVGGDFYDFIPITDKILGLAIADVSGHGLPAALQVRDVYTGLRMGLSRDFKIVRTVERLNEIIHRSTLTSRFVSMVYGELEINGNFIYVNAGHPAPYYVRADGTVQALRAGGAVLGPIRQATYERGFVHLRPGDLVVLTTDGILESQAKGPDGKIGEYGEERLLAVVRAHLERPAKEIVEAVFADVDHHRGRRALKDDRTVVVVRYPG